MIRKRIPSVDDAAIYLMVVRQLLPFARLASPRTQASLPSIVQRLNHNDFTFAAAEARRSPIGFVTGQCRDRKLFIDMLALDERHQGGGIGTILMQAAEQYGRSRGCHEAYLFVDEANVRAQRFYLGKGYQYNAHEPSVHCYRMSKSLMY